MNRMEPLTHKELNSLLLAARESSVRDWCMLLLMYQFGLRASEVGGLLRSDLNERDWTLEIRRLKGSQKTLQVVLPSGDKLLDARKALTKWLAERPNGAYLFPNRQGAGLSRISVYSVFKQHAETAHLPAHKSGPHALKHSIGQHLHDAGLSIEVVAASLGHKKIDSSRRYFDVSFADVTAARRTAINARD